MFFNASLGEKGLDKLQRQVYLKTFGLWTRRAQNVEISKLGAFGVVTYTGSGDLHTPRGRFRLITSLVDISKALEKSIGPEVPSNDNL